ncbi:MAG TPA: glycosyltransferase family 2 protein [Pirellulales bacterium]|nr:glycosyltransferase family 2 protein [Pirellulales bacterium]
MPVCNEAAVIAEVVAEWHEHVLSKLPSGSEMLFDDCSVDGTSEILNELNAAFPYIRVNRSQRDGFFQSALRLYRLAKNDLLFFTDSDGQYVAADFWKIHQHVDDYDMVHGYKAGRNDPFYRKLGSLAFNLAARRCFRSKAIDVNSAFRLIHRPALDAVLDSIRYLRMMPNAEMYLRLERCGYRIGNVPVRHRARLDGQSRSLPLAAFLREGLHSLRGLYLLRHELAAVADGQTPLPTRNGSNRD